MKVLKAISKVWLILSIGFLLIFLGAHLFESGSFQFNDSNELMGFLLFPIAVLLALILSLKMEVLGSILAILSMAVFFVIIPGALSGIWFYLIIAPAFLQLLHSLLAKK